jgi:hypothetical protein
LEEVEGHHELDHDSGGEGDFREFHQLARVIGASHGKHKSIARNAIREAVVVLKYANHFLRVPLVVEREPDAPLRTLQRDGLVNYAFNVLFHFVMVLELLYFLN